MFAMATSKFRKLTNEWKLTARTVKTLYDAVDEIGRFYADNKRVRFRGRKLGAEAIVNVATWHFADMDRARQEAVLLAYLPRLESYLIGGDEDAQPDLKEGLGGTGTNLDPKTGEPLRPKRRKGGV